MTPYLSGMTVLAAAEATLLQETVHPSCIMPVNT
jgi:hypothetical protein